MTAFVDILFAAQSYFFHRTAFLTQTSLRSTWYIDLGPFRTPSPKQILSTEIVHTSGTFLIFFEKCQTLFFNHVPIYSQIHRIRIRYSKLQFPFTKTPKKPKHFRKKLIVSKYFGKFQKFKMFKNPIFYFAFCTRSTIHIFCISFLIFMFLQF